MKRELMVSLIQNKEGRVDVLGCRSYEISDKNTITKELVDSFVERVDFETIELYGKPTTQMTYKLLNGFIGSDSTTSVDPSNYSFDIGKEILMKRLEDKIWFGLGFALGMAK
ncbi:MAG: Gp49 family protein [Cetobacterium sp.]|uniref:Gp49 family protein n=1 Tax=Cetobacterium sp. TaxID=2071632 RepID=UPI003F2A873B